MPIDALTRSIDTELASLAGACRLRERLPRPL
jgi:hypothetical protein